MNGYKPNHDSIENNGDGRRVGTYADCFGETEARVDRWR